MKAPLFLHLILAFSIFSACESPATDSPTPSPSAVTERKFTEISPKEAQTALGDKNAQFIDVRTEEEYSGGHAANALNFPLAGLEQDLAKLDKDEPVYVICATGRRSRTAAEILSQRGFKHVFSLAGGTAAWRAAGLSTE
jgi:rhodanese-related sulfurtransferase